MSLSINERDAIIKLALERRPEVVAFISTEGSANTANFLPGVEYSISMFVEICASLVKINEGIEEIKTFVDHVFNILDEFKKRMSGEPANTPKPSGLNERILVALFEAHANQFKGINEERLAFITGADIPEIKASLKRLEEFQVARVTKKGLWRYVVQGV